MNMVVSHWSANAAVLAGVAAVAVAHLAGLRGLLADARGGGPPLPRGLGREVTAFYFGLLTVVLALVSPLGYWADLFIWVRAVQDILLGVVAPALIVLGAPWLVLWRGLPRAGAAPRPAAPGIRPGAAAGPIPPRWLSWPVAVTILFALVWCGWYIPVLYDAGLHHSVVLAGQAVTYLGVGVAFWLQLIGSRPVTPMFAPLYRVMLITAVVLCSTILGMVLGFSATVLYPPYLGVGHHRLLTVVADQQAGGAELWVLVLLPYVITGVALLVRWLKDEESQALTLSLDRMVRPPKSAWPTRTGLR